MNTYQVVTKIKSKFFGRFPHSSYSRAGEDLILEEILGRSQIKGFYVDVGAFHPVDYSNTYRFYLKGWNGINVDANFDAIEKFRRIRRRDININVAIGDNDDEIKYYVFNEDASMNTSSEEFMNKVVRQNKLTIKETRVIKVQRLSKLLDQYILIKQQIDFLSIDVEGMDLEVLQTNDWDKYRPRVILVETDNTLENLSSSETVDFLRNKGYKEIAYSPVTLNAGNIYFIEA